MEKDELISLIAHAVASGTHSDAIEAIEKYDQERLLDLEIIKMPVVNSLQTESPD